MSKRSRAAVLASLTLCVQACGGVSEGTPHPKPDDGGACVITRSVGRGSDTSDPRYERVRYDSTTRVLTRESSLDADFAEIRSTERSLLDEEGRELARVAEDSYNHMSWRFDRTFDAQGNLLESLATYTDDLEFAHVPSGGHYGEQRFEHEYDADGKLSESHTRVWEPGSWNYSHWSYHSGSNGDCERIEAEGEQRGSSQESFVYERGRLSGTRVLLDVQGAKLEIETKLRYDGKGRISAVEQDGDEHSHASVDGVLDVVRSYEYDSDGSATRTDVDYTCDTPNETLERDGDEIWLCSSTEHRSAKCAAIVEKLDRPRSKACGFLTPLVSDPLDR